MRTFKDKSQPNRNAIHLPLLLAVVFLAPLIAGKMIPILDLVFVGLTFVTAVLWVIDACHRPPVIPPRFVILLSALLFFLFVCSAFDSVSLGLTIRQIANFTSYLLIFLMTVALAGHQKALCAVSAAAGVSATLVGAFAVREYFLSGVSGWRTFSTFYNPDFLAGFMALTLPITLSWFLSKVSPGISVLSALGVLFCFGALLLSGSRLGVLSAVGGVVLLTVLAALSGSFRRHQINRTLLIILPATIVALVLGRPLFHRMASTAAESHSGEFRLYTWRGTLRMAAAHPVNGVGLGAFEIAYPKYALVGYTRLAHNSYLQIAGEIGPAGTIVLVLLLGASVIPAARTLVRRIPEDLTDPTWQPSREIWIAGLLAGIAASLARNLVDSDWYVMGISIPFWTMVGTCVALSQHNVRFGWPISKRVAIGVLIILCLAGLGILTMLAGKVCAFVGNQHLRNGHIVEALDCYTYATKLDPLNVEYYRRLGQIYMLSKECSEREFYAEQAQHAFQTAIDLEPNNAKNYYQLGRLFESLGEEKKVIEAFQKARENSPNALPVLLALADAYERTGYESKAMETWQYIARLEQSPHGQIRAIPEIVEPAFVLAHGALGRHLEGQGNVSGAIREYRKALHLVDAYWDSMRKMGPILEAGDRRNLQMENRIRNEERRLRSQLANLEHRTHSDH